jgi:virginiamycin B lyase
MSFRWIPAALIALSTLAGCSTASFSPGSSIPPGHDTKIQIEQSQPPSAWAQFTLPSSQAEPFGIALGSDKNVWFAESGVDKIGRITPQGVITEFVLPSGVSPTSVAKSKSGKIWFTATGAGGRGIVGSISTAGIVKSYDTPTAASGPFGIAPGSDGNMWFTEKASSAVGVVTLTGAITEYPTISPNAAPAGIWTGSDGALWFAEPGAARIGRVTTSGSLSEFAGPAQPTFVTLGQDHNVWFTDPPNHSVGRITPAGVVTEYAISSGAEPNGITTTGGDIWYIDQAAVALQNITTSKHLFSGAFSIPGTAPSPQLLTFGADGNVWFTEPGADAIGVYDLHPLTATPSTIDFTAAGQTQSFAVSEVGYSGLFSVSGCPSQVSTVSPDDESTSFTVTAVAAGSCTLTVSDSQFNSTPIAVTVTTTDFGIQ